MIGSDLIDHHRKLHFRDKASGLSLYSADYIFTSELISPDPQHTRLFGKLAALVKDEETSLAIED